ncbi:MAG: hypothetical protein O6765_08005 [Gammaproteobacteria bacterium]|nr:hypothetical protein [Gammaproteobacteria bacterium]
MQAALGLAATFALTSCASRALQGYPGSPRPDSRTALVEVERATRSPLAANLQITSIDAPRGEVIPVTASSVRLLPGEVCVGVLATSSTLGQESAELCFDTFAGSTYEIRVLVEGAPRDFEDNLGGLRAVQGPPFGITRIWIVNAATREVVASFTP